MPYSRRFIDRHFLAVLCIVFAVLFVPLMLREWVSLRAEGLNTVEWHTIAMAKLLERDLAGQQPLTETLAHLDEQEIQATFDLHVRQKIGYLDLLKIRIYDAAGKMIYSVEEGQVGKIYPESEERRAALSGQIVSEIINRDQYLKEYGQEISADLVEVYMPIVSEIDGSVPFILEAYYDYSPIMVRNRSLLLKSALSLLVTVLVIMVLLIYLYKSRQGLGRRLKTLEAILPICMYCKKIHLEEPARPDKWMEVEAYFAEQDDLRFSHGICPACLQKHYPDSKVAKSMAEDKKP